MGLSDMSSGSPEATSWETRTMGLLVSSESFVSLRLLNSGLKELDSRTSVLVKFQGENNFTPFPAIRRLLYLLIFGEHLLCAGSG